MNKKPDTLIRLINALKVPLNVSPKSAQRTVHQLLQHKREETQELADTLQNVLRLVHHCKLYNIFCEEELCGIYNDSDRNPHRLMIVHMPADVFNMGVTNCHNGLYFVLMGQVSLAQGTDLSAVTLDKLIGRLQNSETEEIIIATNFTAEGDATACVLVELFKNLSYKVSRLARGIPLGGELEYVDAGTLAQAVYERRSIKEQSENRRCRLQTVCGFVEPIRITGAFSPQAETVNKKTWQKVV